LSGLGKHVAATGGTGDGADPTRVGTVLLQIKVGKKSVGLVRGKIGPRNP